MTVRLREDLIGGPGPDEGVGRNANPALTVEGGYRGVFGMCAGKRVGQPFRWDDEFTPAKPLPPNNQVVIYEMPVKWMSSDAVENPLVELGTLERVIFEQLDRLIGLGINCIELLPIEDTAQTLDWGDGTRFFFAPDYDLGSPIDTRFFIKSCHQRQASGATEHTAQWRGELCLVPRFWRVCDTYDLGRHPDVSGR